ncbi:hypothetical protein ACHELX_004230 [Vibrio vulnificus]
MELVDINYKPLNSHSEAKFIRLREYLAEKDKEGDILLVYRGEELRNIKKRLFKVPDNVSGEALFDRLFFIGDKARHLHLDGNANDRGALMGLNDCSQETFEYIFRRLQNICQGKMRRKVTEHTSNKFQNYFLDDNNLPRFVDSVNRAFNDKSLLKIRDYYLYLLHAAGSEGVRVETTLVSTSTNPKIAYQFSRVHQKPQNKVIFHYFVPAPFYKLAVAPWISEHHQSIVVSCGLPTYKPYGLFPSQREVAIKGALFPHFIIGVELLDKKQFVVNSYALDLDENQFDYIARSGFDIDQSNFAQRILDTAYLAYGQTDLNGNYQQINV